MKAPSATASEADFQRFVTDALDLAGWSWHHETDSRKSKSGFPDLVASHPQRGILFAELKTERGKLRPEQEVVLRELAVAIGGGFDAMLGATAGRRVYVRLWRPSMWRDVLDVTGVSRMIEGEAA